MCLLYLQVASDILMTMTSLYQIILMVVLLLSFTAKFSYGKSGRFDYKLEINKNTFIEFNGPKISGGEHWYDQ